jgi:hypothetical protein
MEASGRPRLETDQRPPPARPSSTKATIPRSPSTPRTCGPPAIRRAVTRAQGARAASRRHVVPVLRPAFEPLSTFEGRVASGPCRHCRRCSNEIETALSCPRWVAPLARFEMSLCGSTSWGRRPAGRALICEILARAAARSFPTKSHRFLQGSLGDASLQLLADLAG